MQRIATHCNDGTLSPSFTPRVLRRLPITYRHDRERPRGRELEPQRRAYRLGVVSLAVRQARFGRFVDRALRDAYARGMTTAQIETATRVGSSTYFRWRKGEWKGDPNLAHVKSFCAGLGLDLDEAYRALDWHTDEREATEPAPLQNPRLRELARRLADPATRPEDRAMIEEMIRIWIARLDASRREAQR
jgi:transcriptional regulator with XRE-family HTH domain